MSCTHFEFCFEGIDALGTPRDQGSVLTLKSALRVFMASAHPGIKVVYLRRETSCNGT